MKRAIGWNLGLRGDIIMNTVVARAFCESAPGWHVTLGVGPEFADMEPLFHKHPHIDAFHAYKTYDNWPSQEDKDYLLAAHYDTVFNPMPRHTHDQWWRWLHQGQEACWMNGLKEPSDGHHCHLVQWFDITPTRDTVAFAPFAGWYSPNNDKRLSVARAQEVVNLIRARGYKVLQIGGPDEPALEGARKPRLSYFESVKAVLGCRLLVHTDTGLGWTASAYQFPQLGLYSHAYYGEDRVCAIQPVNKNGRYLSAARAEEIPLDKLVQALQDMGV